MSKGLYPIRTISAMTGVNPVTLRAWERRYGLIRPQRTPKGHRLYTERDIDRIKQILVLMDRGIPISQARQVLDEGESGMQADGAAAAEPDQDVWSGFLDRMHTAISVYDEQALDDVHEEALSLFPAGQVQHHLLEPLHRHYSEQPTSGVGAFVNAWLRTILDVRLRHRSRRASGPRLILATPPRAATDIPLLFLALEAIDHGYRTLLLSGVSGDALRDAVQDSGAAAVLLWTDQDGEQAQTLAGIQLPVFLAGEQASTAGDCVPLAGTPRDIIGELNVHYGTAAYAPA